MDNKSELPFSSKDEDLDYKIIKDYSGYYNISNKSFSLALKESYSNKKKIPFNKEIFYKLGYSFRLKSVFSFETSVGCFYEFVFQYDNHLNKIESVYFEIYYKDTGNCVAKVYERVKRNRKGNLKLHIFYNSDDSKQDQLRIHLCSIIYSSPEINRKIKQIEPYVCMLKKCISKLPSYEALDIKPPQKGDEVVHLPIEGTYNSRFFSRIFLLRDHTIDNIIISEFDMIQYQIPVKADNENLMLVVYGTHLLEDIYEPSVLINARGISMCDNIDEKIKSKSKIINSILSIREIVESANQDIDSIKHKKLYSQYKQLVETLYKWINNMLCRAKLEYEKYGYNEVKWISEYKLYNLVSLWYPDAIFQYNTKWLNKQSIDIFLPSERIGIEYQGQQHFEAIEYFGGKENLLYNTKRDQIKLRLCKENDVKLLYWNYNQKITFTGVSNFLSKQSNDIIEQLKRFRSVSVRSVLDGVQTHLRAERQKTKISQDNKNRVIRQYSKSGKFLNEYTSIKNAAIQSDTNMSSIQKCLAGERKTAGGYIWRREKGSSKPQNSLVQNESTHKSKSVENNGQPKSVIQIDAFTGEVIKIYDSISQAARSVGINNKGIRDVLCGKQKTSGGYAWQLVDKKKRNNK